MFAKINFSCKNSEEVFELTYWVKKCPIPYCQGDRQKVTITYVQACGGIVRKIEGQNQYILLIRKKNSPLWTLPKGHQENDESEQETAIREVQEETGYCCRIEKKAGEIQFQYQKNDQNFYERVNYFIMIPKNNLNAFDTGEVEEVHWAEIREAQSLLFYQNEKNLIQNIIQKKI